MSSTIKMGNYEFERVNTFKYLGSTVTQLNDITHEIKHRLMAANRAYYALLKLLRSRVLSLVTKVNIYKTLIRPVMTYASETWSVTKKNFEMLDMFERRILRRIVGPVQEGAGWRRRHNHELYSIYNNPPIRKIIKSTRLRWAEHRAQSTEHRAQGTEHRAQSTGHRTRGTKARH